jgi:hypothetical protein
MNVRNCSLISLELRISLELSVLPVLLSVSASATVDVTIFSPRVQPAA